jgi:Ca-activated chloride channel family protein
MIFLRPQFLPCFWAVLSAAALWLWWMLRRAGEQEGRFLPAGTPVRRRPAARWLALAAALPVLALALAGPSWDRDVEIRYTSGLDLYFVVDCSYSMLARDIAPSREKAATFLAMSLLKELPGARAGLIAFAGGAFPVCPLTSDADIINSLLAQLHPDVLNRQGTNFEAPLETLARMLAKTDSRRRTAVVFLSDGEAFREPSVPVLEALDKRSLEFVAVGVGTPEGAFVEDPRTRMAQFIRDKDGQMVRSRLEEKNLIALSQSLGGRYYRLETVGLASRQILEGTLKNRGGGTYSSQLRPKDQSGWFIGAGALLLSAFLVTGRGGRRKPRAAAAAMAALALAAGCGRPGPDGLIRQGNDLYWKGDYPGAAGSYQAALARAARGSDSRALAAANLAAALILGGRSGEAAGTAEQALREGAPASRREALTYNLGCGQVLEDRRAEALESFRRCLEQDPADFQARWNLELLLWDTQSPPPPGTPPPAPPDDQDDRLLDSLKDQEKTLLPRSRTQPAGTGGPYW